VQQAGVQRGGGMPCARGGHAPLGLAIANMCAAYRPEQGVLQERVWRRRTQAKRAALGAAQGGRAPSSGGTGAPMAAMWGLSGGIGAHPSCGTGSVRRGSEARWAAACGAGGTALAVPIWSG
jgi:hypothetical protein